MWRLFLLAIGGPTQQPLMSSPATTSRCAPGARDKKDPPSTSSSFSWFLSVFTLSSLSVSVSLCPHGSVPICLSACPNVQLPLPLLQGPNSSPLLFSSKIPSFMLYRFLGSLSLYIITLSLQRISLQSKLITFEKSRKIKKTRPLNEKSNKRKTCLLLGVEEEEVCCR